MATNSYAKQNIKQLEIDCRKGEDSVLQIAKRYEMNEATLRRWIKRFGWHENKSELKREKVKAKLNDIKPGDTSKEADAKIEQAAVRDADDMNLALRNARKVLVICSNKLEQQGDAIPPEDLKKITDVNQNATATIRKIRGLDDPDRPDENVKQVSSLLQRVMASKDGLPEPK